jgi:hypothetical protein
LLQEAIESVRQLESETVQGNELRLAFVAGAREVIKLVDPWEKHRTPTRLGELVEGVHRLRRGGEPQALLSKISVGNNIILQYIALFGAYYISAILRIAISY